MTTTATITRTRTSLPTFLYGKGIQFSTDVRNGRMVYIIEGVEMLHGEVAAKFGYVAPSHQQQMLNLLSPEVQAKVLAEVNRERVK